MKETAHLKSLQVVKELACRFTDLEFVHRVVSSEEGWNPLSISGGWPGLVLLFSSLDNAFPEEGWDQSSHQCVLKIKEAIETRGIGDYSFFGGLTGICFAIGHASRKKTRYVKFLNTLQDFLVNKIKKELISKVRDKIQTSIPLKMEDFDPISGLSGIGNYLIQNKDDPVILGLLQEILGLMISYTHPKIIKGHSVPGWYLPSEYEVIDEIRLKFPQGNFNLSLSHGITGVLAFLTNAALKGVVVAGQMEAIKQTAAWVQSKRKEVNGSLFWEDRVSFEEELGMFDNTPKSVTQDSWCYGAPGIARTLYLAGKAMGEQILIEFAEESFHSIFDRSEHKWGLTTPTFCHGMAGLLMITSRMANDTHSPELHEWVHCLEEELLGFYNPEDPFGFKEEKYIGNMQYKEVDSLGLINGVEGILLTLLAVSTGQSSWNLPFLI